MKLILSEAELMRRPLFPVITAAVVFCTSAVIAADQNEADFQAAKTEYEKASPQDESARLTYVNKLAQIIDRNVQERWKTGVPNPDYLKVVDAINLELKKHPMPNNSIQKSFESFLWDNGNRHVTSTSFAATASMASRMVRWIHRGTSRATRSRCLTGVEQSVFNSKYLIFSEGDTVFFHSRVAD